MNKTNEQKGKVTRLATVNTMEVRCRRLWAMMRDEKSTINILSLLDAMQVMIIDLSLPALAKNQNVKVFLKRYKKQNRVIRELMINTSDFDKIKVIGRGGFGEVQLVRHKESHTVYAMKLINKYKMSKYVKWVLDERNFMILVSSPWLVQMHYAFQDRQNLYMVMDFMPGGDLAYLIQKGTLSEEVAKFYAAELTLAVDAVHSMNYIHCDIKPENILLDAKGHLKLADFGLCVKMDVEGLVHFTGTVGTCDYMAPEVVSSNTKSCYCGKEIDWWSAGVCVYEMLVGDTPFSAKLQSSIYDNILNHRKSFKFPENVTISNEARDFISSLLSDKMVRLGRSGITEIKQHPWFKNKSWTFSSIRKAEAPVVPTLKSDDDTSHFREKGEDESNMKIFPTPEMFEGNHLPFAGFSYFKEKMLASPKELTLSQRELLDNVETLEEKLKTCCKQLDIVTKELEEERAVCARLRKEEMETSNILQEMQVNLCHMRESKQKMEKHLQASLEAERKEKSQLSKTISELLTHLSGLEDKVESVEATSQALSQARTENSLLKRRLADLVKEKKSEVAQRNKELMLPLGPKSTANRVVSSRRIKADSQSEFCCSPMSEMSNINIDKTQKSMVMQQYLEETVALRSTTSLLNAHRIYEFGDDSMKELSDNIEKLDQKMLMHEAIVSKKNQVSELKRDSGLPLEKSKQRKLREVFSERMLTLKHSYMDVRENRKAPERKHLPSAMESSFFCNGHEFVLTCYNIQGKCTFCYKRMWKGLECRNCFLMCHKYHVDMKNNLPICNGKIVIKKRAVVKPKTDHPPARPFQNTTIKKMVQVIGSIVQNHVQQGGQINTNHQEKEAKT